MKREQEREAAEKAQLEEKKRNMQLEQARRLEKERLAREEEERCGADGGETYAIFRRASLG